MSSSSSGRVPPHDLDAESAVLSALMTDATALDQVQEILTPEHFYSPANRWIYEGCLALAREGSPVDLVTVGSWLRSRERIVEVGGVPYLSKVIDAAPSVANVDVYGRIIREKWRIRALIQACQKISAEGYGDVGHVQTFIDGAEQAIYDLARSPESSSVAQLRDVIRTVFIKLEEIGRRGSQITGFPTGFAKLDEITSGLHPTDLVIVAARPGMGKCLTRSTEILLADGSLSTLEAIVQRRRGRLLSLGADARLRLVEPSHFVDDGVKPAFRVTMRSGRVVETTLSHPFLTMTGWRPLEHLQPGQRVAVPRVLPVFGEATWRPCEVILLGYLLGGGSLAGPGPAFTSASPRLLDDLDEAIGAFGGLTTRRSGVRRPAPSARAAARPVARSGARVARPRGRVLARKHGASPPAVSVWVSGESAARSPLVGWLERLGLWQKEPREAFLPPEVFTLRREQIALLLNRLFASGGRVGVSSSGRPRVGYRTASERLARQIAHLLLRFGVLASCRPRRVIHRGEARGAWIVLVTHGPSLLTFCDEIGAFGKEDAIARVRLAVASEPRGDGGDTIPAEVWGLLDRARGGRPWAELARAAGLGGEASLRARGRGLSRGRLLALARAAGDRRLEELATSDLFWDEIAAIEPIGRQQVYDLTIPETHNFVAGDVCVHNTSFVLNLAISVASSQTYEPSPDDPTGQAQELPGGACVVFSLEMPKEQIASRIVCSEARVDVQKVRSGRLGQQDWHALTQAASFLSQLPIYVDDTPGITVLDVRSKVRRIQAELQRAGASTGVDRKVGLVVVDYLQLMKGSDKAGSREQEISEISRGLKHLAKELKVPVIALSQLNRSVETRSEKSKRPQISDLRECVVGETLVSLADGRRVPIRELVGQTPEVLAFCEPGRFVAARSDMVWKVGRRPVFDVVLASGRRIRATGQHRLYGPGGWVRVEALSVGDRLATALAQGGDERLQAATVEVSWDRVQSIEPAGEEDVYDLTVPGPASWLAGGIVSHNSGAIEQDADMIMFIYRDDYYNKETHLKGIAEIIIAKQRNGPTGKVLLKWDGACTRFLDPQPGEMPEGIDTE